MIGDNKSSEQGVTLIELLIALGLLSIVLVIAYNIYYFGTQSFQRGESRANVQREMRLAADYITQQLRLAHKVELKPMENGDFEETDNYIFIEDGSVIHRYYDEDDNEVVDLVILNSDYESLGYNFKVEKKEIEENGDYRELDNVVYFEIASDIIDYTINTSVIALNLSPADTITGDDSSSVYFSKSPELDEEPPDDDPPDGCFIATAAFGSEKGPFVSVLRAFRDKHMMNRPSGKAFVSLYYRYSPSVAAVINRSPVLRVSAGILLCPVVAIAFGFIYPWFFPVIILITFLLYLLWKKRYSFCQANNERGN